MTNKVSSDRPRWAEILEFWGQSLQINPSNEQNVQSELMTKTKECGLETENVGDIHQERPLVDEQIKKDVIDLAEYIAQELYPSQRCEEIDEILARYGVINAG